RTRSVATDVVDCCALAEDALRYTTDLRTTNAVTVERRFDGAAIHASADANLLRPVLLNLIRNAIQAMPDGGTLTVVVTGGGDTVEIGVRDTGPGIAPGEADLNFRPFYTTRAKGTGLGLAVARELVGAMGGRLGMTSEP